MRPVLAALGLAVSLAACRPDAPPPPPAEEAREIPIEDVAPPPDAALSTAGDRQGRVRRETFSGVLPGNFPGDVPVYEPSTLVDFGSAPGARGYVVFQTAEAPAVARTRYRDRLQARGFVPSGDGATYSQGERVLRVLFEDARPGTRIRLEYRPE